MNVNYLWLFFLFPSVLLLRMLNVKYKRIRLYKKYAFNIDIYDYRQSKTIIEFSRRKNQFKLKVQEIFGYFDNSIKRVLLVALIPIIVAFFLNTFYLKTSLLWLCLGFDLITFFYLINYLKAKRRAAFIAEFLNILNMLSSAISAGQSINQAIAYVGIKYTGIVGREFANLGKYLSKGEEINDALNKVAKKLNYGEFHFFLMAIRINFEKGGELDDVLNNIYRILSEKVKMENKKKSMTAEARMSAMILACIPIFFLCILKFLQPENFDFVFFDPRGKYILYYLIGSEMLGMGIIKWLMSGI